MALRGVPKLITIAPMVLLYPSSEISVAPNAGQTFKFTLHILSDTSGDSQRLKYILLMICPYRISYDGILVDMISIINVNIVE
jgi:hypothetical protein